MRIKPAPDPCYNGRLYDWKIIRKFPNGHKYFKDRCSGCIGIADVSGRKPHTTTAGVRWLDTTGKCDIVGPSSNEASCFMVPLLNVERQKTNVLVSLAEAVWLSAYYLMSIRVKLSHGDFFVVHCKIEGV